MLQSRCSGVQGAFGAVTATIDGITPLNCERLTNWPWSTRGSRIDHNAVCSTITDFICIDNWSDPDFWPLFPETTTGADDPGSSIATSPRISLHSGGTLPFSTPRSSTSSG